MTEMDRDTPMVGGTEEQELHGTDLEKSENPRAFVGEHEVDDAMDVGETGALARSEQRRQGR